MNETLVREPHRKPEFSLLRVFLGVLIGIMILAYLIGPRPVPRERANVVICLANLHALRAALSLYAEEHGGAYPPAEKWCDSLAGRYVREVNFRCRRGEGGPCDYALNPLAQPGSARDVALLFECASGWNRSGEAAEGTKQESRTADSTNTRQPGA